MLMIDKSKNNFLEFFSKKYGIKNLTFDEEIALPKAQKSTRHNKICIIDNCDYMKMLIDSIESRAKRIPELDEAKHAMLVKEWADKTNEVLRYLEEVALYDGDNRREV